MTYKSITINHTNYPDKKGTYFAITERGNMIVIEWTGEITIGWRNCDIWLKPYKNKLNDQYL